MEAPIVKPNIYIPDGAVCMANAKLAQIRLGIQGTGGSGKTWAATTFPNPFFFSTDRGLGAHIGREDIYEYKFYDNEFVRLKFPGNVNLPWTERKKEAVVKFFETVAINLTEEQTLVVDNSTGLQNIWAAYTANTRFLSNKGVENDFTPWRLKQEFFASICEIFKSLKCNVIYMCHEVDAKKPDGKGNYVYDGKVKPLLTGAFGDEIVGHFTDWFRQLSGAKMTEATASTDKLAAWGCKTFREYQELVSCFPLNTVYLWQTNGDDVFDAKASSLIGVPQFIPATYKSFQKYMRKATTI